jgi:uncharacterized membrane protein YeiH
MNKKWILWVFIIAFVTAVGGGTLRDILIGRHASGMDAIYVYVIIISLYWPLFLEKNSIRCESSFFYLIPLGWVFLLYWTKGINIGLHPVICVALGTMTACFGGVIRYFMYRNTCYFLGEIYATIILGGIVLYPSNLN